MLHRASFAHQHKNKSARGNDHESRGSIAIIAALSFIPLTIMFAVVIDTGRSWVVRERLQNGVEAGAVAAAQMWMQGGASCQTSALRLVSANGADPVDLQCSSSGTSRNGRVHVSANENVRPMFSVLLDRTRVQVNSSTTIKIGATSRVGGLRPISLCADNVNIKRWIESGMPSGVTERVLFQSPGVLCGGNVSGNWTVLDFNGGSSSNSETQEWVVNGYPNPISVGDVVYGTPGAPSTSIRFNEIIGKVIVFPMFKDPIGSGSNARYTIVGFARAKVISVQLSGPSAQRGFTLQFEKGSLAGNLGGSGAIDFGVVSWSVCSFDSVGVCS